MAQNLGESIIIDGSCVCPVLVILLEFLRLRTGGVFCSVIFISYAVNLCEQELFLLLASL